MLVSFLSAPCHTYPVCYIIAVACWMKAPTFSFLWTCMEIRGHVIQQPESVPKP